MDLKNYEDPKNEDDLKNDDEDFCCLSYPLNCALFSIQMSNLGRLSSDDLTFLKGQQDREIYYT